MEADFYNHRMLVFCYERMLRVGSLKYCCLDKDKTCRDTLYKCTKEGDQYVGKGYFLHATLASFLQGFLAFLFHI